MRAQLLPARQAALVLLGENILAVGPCFLSRRQARQAVQYYMRKLARVGSGEERASRLLFVRQADSGYYRLVIKSGPQELVTHCLLDELMLRRLVRSCRQGIFILTCFYESSQGPVCLAFTEGLGVVLHSP
ncbi:MAG: hypothetical protein ACUVTU_12390 [Desulfurispora sp.]|uniref:hypothetical protein n=1 Tax=Desulfurispora sp. TaxID=3014275 RepID=UPI00404B0EB0